MEGSKEVVEAYHKVADLMKVRPVIYWTDLVVSAGIGWTSLFFGCRSDSPAIALGFGVVAMLALYRAVLFIHEITHLRRGALPGFRSAWNALVGVPLLVPTFFYVGVHLDHHNPNYYGTKQDPEYHVLIPGTRFGLAAFVLVSALVPVGLFLRFAVLTPLSHVWPWLRRIVIESASSLVINPNYKRTFPRSAQEQKEWLILENLACLWCLGHIAAVISGLYPLHYLLYSLGVLAGVAVLNQIRTLVAHRFEEHEESLSFEDQLTDSYNYPGPMFLTELWAPVGLRYHALHHYLPGLPYHSLHEAHRRLSAELPAAGKYNQASSRGFGETLRGMLKKLRAA